MKKLFIGALAALFSAAALATTYTPLSLISTTGSASGQAIVSTGPTTSAAWTSIVDSVIAGSGITVSGATGNVTVSVATNGIALSQIAQQTSNTVLANATGSTANVTAFSMPSCSTSVSALNWTTGTGFTCNTGLITASTAASTFATIAQATTALVATGGSINGVTTGQTTPLAGTFTVLKGNSNVKLQYKNSSAQSIPAATATTITGWTVVFDANSNFAPSTGVFTAPATGFYRITAQMLMSLTGTLAAGNQFMLSIVSNSVTVASCTNVVGFTTQPIIQQTCGAAVSLTAGQTASVQITQSTSSAQTLNTTAVANTIDIVQIP